MRGENLAEKAIKKKRERIMIIRGKPRGCEGKLSERYQGGQSKENESRK